jgi:hypothetical protein
MEPVSLRHLKEYLAGTDDWDDAALEPGPDGSIAAPPLFFLAACRRVVPPSQLAEDGQYLDVTVPGVEGRSLAGEHDIEVLGRVCVGDVLTVRDKVVDIQEKQGRSGPIVLVTRESSYTNQRGEAVARDRLTLIFR